MPPSVTLTLEKDLSNLPTVLLDYPDHLFRLSWRNNGIDGTLEDLPR
jgi:hypothetical protein